VSSTGFSLMVRWAAVASPALDIGAPASAPAPALRKARPQSGFAGIWWHPRFPFEPLSSGPRPVTNSSRRKDTGSATTASWSGSYQSDLQPWAAEVVKKKGELSLAGVTYPNSGQPCGLNPCLSFTRIWNCPAAAAHQVTILYEQIMNSVRSAQSHQARSNRRSNQASLGRRFRSRWERAYVMVAGDQGCR